MDHDPNDEPMDSTSGEQITSESEQYSAELSQASSHHDQQETSQTQPSMEYAADMPLHQSVPQSQFSSQMHAQQDASQVHVVPQGAQQTQYLRSTVMRPITADQLEAMRTGNYLLTQRSAGDADLGSYVQPGSSLADFINDLDQYAPAIPDAVALYFMRKNGIDNPDPRVVRLFSLATQKFVSDIALDAMQQVPRRYYASLA